MSTCAKILRVCHKNQRAKLSKMQIFFFSGIPYVSKVHEFLAFLDSMRYGKLIIEPREEKKMFLIDELPLVINTEQINLILENLEVLLKSNAHPVVFIFTEGDSKGLKSSLSSEFPETLRKWLREKYRVAEVPDFPISILFYCISFHFFKF